MRLAVRIFFVCYTALPLCFAQDQAPPAPNQQAADEAQSPALPKPGLGFSDPANHKNPPTPATEQKSDQPEVPQLSSADMANIDELAKMIFSRRPELPGSPDAKDAIEGTACPGGAGNPCALLGGRRYYPDSWHITEHQKTWGDALKTPGMLFSTGVLFGATVVDIEGTQHCINAGACREQNPLMGQKSKAQKYAVAMPLNGVLTWFAVREKQHGRGVFPFFMMWTVSTMHLYYGVNGMR